MRLCDSIKEAIGNLAKDSASLIRLSVILTSFERNMQMLVQRMEGSLGLWSIIETHYDGRQR